MDLSSKVALVTGGGSGLGRASAIQMARSGADIALWGRTESKLTETADEIRSIGQKCRCFQVDVTKIDQIPDAVQKIRSELGEIDILVNSAGINILQHPEEVTPDAWSKIMDTNVRGLFFCCQAVGRQSMIPRQKGVIINISSQAGQIALPRRTVYCSSKGAVNQLTKGLALSWGKYNIRVNAVSPTYVETPLTEKMLADPDFRDYVMNNIALNRLPTSEEVANTVCFLASDNAETITGAIVLVDAGWTIH